MIIIIENKKKKIGINSFSGKNTGWDKESQGKF